MTVEQVDMEYMSLHRYLRNTPSDTEVLTEHQLRMGKSPWLKGKTIQNNTKLGRTKEGGGEEESQWDWTCSQPVGELKQGSNLYIRATVWFRGETFEAQSEEVDLWQPKWSENHRQSLPQSYTPPKSMWVPQKAQWLEAIGQGLWSHPRVRPAADCKEMAQENVREETVVGSACEGKPGSPWKQGDTAM